MKALFGAIGVLTGRIKAWARCSGAEACEEEDVTAMVNVGDVYALRVQRKRRPADGWGRYRYTCDSRGCPRLP